MSKTLEDILKEAKNNINEFGDKEIIELAQRYAQSQTQELTAWKESASKVFKNLDLQAIGKTLGIGLGEDVSTNVLPKTQELQEQNAELVNVIKDLIPMAEDGYRLHKNNGSHQDFLEDDRDILKKAKELLTKYNHLKSNTNETDKI